MKAGEVSIEEVSQAIAPAMVVILRGYPGQSPAVQKYLRDTIDWMVRELPICATLASERAIAAAIALKIPTLRGFWWHHQPKFDKGRQILHWEHVAPVSDIRNALLQIQDPDENSVSAILERYEIAWITKEEDKLLKRFGRLSPHEEYQAAGIVLQKL